MKIISSLRVACILGGLLAACSESDGTADVSPAPAQDAGIATPPVPVVPSTDAGPMAAPSTPAPIPLLAWVDLLVDQHTRDDALPDTVDDKNISDAEDSAQFEKHFTK